MVESAPIVARIVIDDKATGGLAGGTTKEQESVLKDVRNILLKMSRNSDISASSIAAMGKMLTNPLGQIGALAVSLAAFNATVESRFPEIEQISDMTGLPEPGGLPGQNVVEELAKVLGVSVESLIEFLKKSKESKDKMGDVKENIVGLENGMQNIVTTFALIDADGMDIHNRLVVFRDSIPTSYSGGGGRGSRFSYDNSQTPFENQNRQRDETYGSFTDPILGRSNFVNALIMSQYTSGSGNSGG